MHRTALILTACLFLAGRAGAAGLEPGAALPLDGMRAATIPAWRLLVQAPDPAESNGSEAGPSQAEDADSSASNEDIPVVQEIIAGVLTGSLAAILMLKLLYGRRRRKDPSR